MAEIPAPGSGYTVTGGKGSILVEYADLEDHGARLDRAAEQLASIRDNLQRIWSDEADLAYLQPPAAAAAAVEELARAVPHLLRCLEAARDSAADLRTAAERYRGAEGRSERMGGASGLIPTLALLFTGRGAGGFPERAVVERLPLRFIDAGILKLAVGAASPGSHGLRPITVEKSPQPGARVPVDGSAAGLLNRSAVLLEENDPGVIEVLRIDRSGGPVFVVTLPGTQPGGRTAGANPFDNFGNAEGRAHQSRYIAAAVAEALRQAQAGAGDAVILVGYSQGGIHAANAAGQLETELGVEVRYVLTAGAPAGDAEIPSRTQVLHLEHQQDWVAGVDGTSNPDTPTRTTMTLTDPVPGTPGETGGLGPAHKLPVYLNGAASADASSDPSLRASLEGVSAVVGAGSIATRELYRFTRTPTRPTVKPVPRGLPPLPRPPGPQRLQQ
ncbi:alpha/beta hydrolase [Arthrobacter sp. Helios]|uniref:alpha/beta hydrolase n=1 Tax=Arthrobacter sp. Helios TaxID=2828862 RepID=UPI00206BBBC8|nr:alpha/beta hydrolase [Arthrobacter sp. Helios]UPO76479.1 alpha/beta hydrolase [Arthrobacter sp. Helios]